MKNLFFFKTLIILLFAVSAKAENRKINRDTLYFLADTINIPNKSSIIEIGYEGPLRYHTFFCKCIEGYKNNPTFVYNYKQSNYILKEDTLSFPTISLRELLRLLASDGFTFNSRHVFYIIEVLPDKRLSKNKVHLINVSSQIRY